MSYGERPYGGRQSRASDSRFENEDLTHLALQYARYAKDAIARHDWYAARYKAEKAIHYAHRAALSSRRIDQ